MSKSKSPEKFDNKDDLFYRMRTWVEEMPGNDIEYAFVMEHSDHWMMHFRYDQPCYGELRKYKMTHGTMCTRPESEKPDDLFHPFPAGKPFAVCVPFNYEDTKTDSRDNYLRALVAPESPWISGFGSPRSVEFIEKKGHLHGFILWDMGVDPTVMIHLIWATCYVNSSKHYDQVKDRAKLAPNETLAFLLMMADSNDLKYIRELDAYHFGSRLSLRRFLGQQPRDFSGGTFANGYDYNRRMIQDIFYSDTGTEFQEDFLNILNVEFGGWGLQTVKVDDKYFAAIKPFLDLMFNKEDPIVEKPFETHAPVMNEDNVFMISNGWGNMETGDRSRYDDYDDAEDFEYDDDCDCEVCTAIKKKKSEAVAASLSYYQQLNQAPKKVGKK